MPEEKKEMDYWLEIEGRGGFVWRMNHDLADGRIEDADGSIDESIRENQGRIESLVAELKDKFGVIPPKEYPAVEWPQALPPAPKGRIYYWDWYNKMKDVFYRAEYEKIICSACPFSDGVEEFKIGRIPCRISKGIVYSLLEDHICAKVSYEKWSEKRLYKEIFKTYGNKELRRFKEKERDLKKEANA